MGRTRACRSYIELLPEKPSARRWGTFWQLFLHENFSLEFEGVVQEDDLAGLAEELAVGRVDLMRLHGKRKELDKGRQEHRTYCKMLHVAC